MPMTLPKSCENIELISKLGFRALSAPVTASLGLGLLTDLTCGKQSAAQTKIEGALRAETTWVFTD